MSVLKSINYGNVENVTVAAFGNGTLTLTAAWSDERKSSSVQIKSSEYAPINSVTHKPNEVETSDDFNPEMVLSFKNVESINVLRSYLDLCEQYLNEGALGKIKTDEPDELSTK